MLQALLTMPSLLVALERGKRSHWRKGSRRHEAQRPRAREYNAQQTEPQKTEPRIHWTNTTPQKTGNKVYIHAKVIRNLFRN